MAAILNLDVMNLYGRTTDVSALGLDQSTLGRAFTAAAAAEGLKVTSNEEALLRGAYFRSDHFPLARVGVPGTSVENGSSYVGKPADYGKEQKDKYIAERYHQAARRDSALVHLRWCNTAASRHCPDSGDCGQCCQANPSGPQLGVPGGRGGKA